MLVRSAPRQSHVKFNIMIRQTKVQYVAISTKYEIKKGFKTNSRKTAKFVDTKEILMLRFRRTKRHFGFQGLSGFGPVGKSDLVLGGNLEEILVAFAQLRHFSFERFSVDLLGMYVRSPRVVSLLHLNITQHIR